jgi:hypothetical protein
MLKRNIVIITVISCIFLITVFIFTGFSSQERVSSNQAYIRADEELEKTANPEYIYLKIIDLNYDVMRIQVREKYYYASGVLFVDWWENAFPTGCFRRITPIYDKDYYNLVTEYKDGIVWLWFRKK